jgi:putative hydrolase of the HAD superfamily
LEESCTKGWGYNFRKLVAEKFHLDKTEREEWHCMMFVTYEEGHIMLNEYIERVDFYKQPDFSHTE